MWHSHNQQRNNVAQPQSTKSHDYSEFSIKGIPASKLIKCYPCKKATALLPKGEII